MEPVELAAIACADQLWAEWRDALTRSPEYIETLYSHATEKQHRDSCTACRALASLAMLAIQRMRQDAKECEELR